MNKIVDEVGRRQNALEHLAMIRARDLKRAGKRHPGWVVIVERKGHDVRITHPYTRQRVRVKCGNSPDAREFEKIAREWRAYFDEDMEHFGHRVGKEVERREWCQRVKHKLPIPRRY